MAHNRAHRRLFPVAMKDGKVNTGKSQQGEKTCNGIRKNSQRPSAQEEAEEKQQDQAQPNRRYRKRKIHANLASRIWQPAVHRIRSTEMQEIIDPDRATKEVVNERIAISRALAVGHLSEVVHRNAVGERKGEIQRRPECGHYSEMEFLPFRGTRSLYNSAEQLQTGPSNHLTPAACGCSSTQLSVRFRGSARILNCRCSKNSFPSEFSVTQRLAKAESMSVRLTRLTVSPVLVAPSCPKLSEESNAELTLQLYWNQSSSQGRTLSSVGRSVCSCGRRSIRPKRCSCGS